MEQSTLFDDHNDFLLLVYKICSPICLILNALAVYLIIFKSKREIKTYRWHLLHYQIWASAIDIFLNFLYQPVQFLPLLAVAGHGFLITNLGIPTFVCFCVFANLLGGLGASIVQLFLYRHQCIVRYKLTWIQFYFCILSQFFIISSCANIFCQMSYVDPSQWTEMLEKWNPRALELLKIPNVYYMPFAPNIWLFILIGLILIVFTGVITSALAYRILYVLRKQSEYLSIRTRKMQRKFLISLIMQVTTPSVFVFGPLVFACIRIFDGRLGLQILNNLTMMMISSYGIFATMCLIYFNDSYREFFLKNLKRKKTAPMSLFTQTDIRKSTQKSHFNLENTER